MQLYYLPGRGDRLETGPGEALTTRGLAVSGRETVGDFERLSFQDHIELVAGELKTAKAMCCHKTSLLRAPLRVLETCAFVRRVSNKKVCQY